MPFAARINDLTAHNLTAPNGLVSGSGVPNVLIGGFPAAIAGDGRTVHICGLTPPHSPSLFSMGSTTVFIGGRPALRLGDLAGCGAPIITGAFNVLIGG
jgi:uncharacterized Zn-binding protein involved in type VI secretion